MKKDEYWLDDKALGDWGVLVVKKELEATPHPRTGQKEKVEFATREEDIYLKVDLWWGGDGVGVRIRRPSDLRYEHQFTFTSRKQDGSRQHAELASIENLSYYMYGFGHPDKGLVVVRLLDMAVFRRWESCVHPSVCPGRSGEEFTAYGLGHFPPEMVLGIKDNRCD